MIITRFAPSPTGDPHIGNIRTAFFNYLFAKHSGGKFLLRIEDTDQNRYTRESIETIKEALRWLNIAPENIDNPIVQSQRLDLYQAAAHKLVDEGKAYVCNCSKERLEQVRADQTAKKLSPRYDGHCRDLNLPFAEGCVIRMKMPENQIIKFDDLIHGQIKVNSDTLDDQVLLKSDGFPTYHLAHAIDDHEMGTTHVFRGEEWLPSAPKHILLFEMFGFTPPQYAHLPVILSPTKGKLSKRDGATTILEYKKTGYLPEAILNFLALLGWNPKTDKEFFSLEELVEKFDLSGVNKSPAIFDIKKLNNFNRHYLSQKAPEEIVLLAKSHGLEDVTGGEAKLISRGSQDNLREAIESIRLLRQAPQLDKNLLVFRKSSVEATKLGLNEAKKALSQIEQWDSDNIQKALTETVAKNNLQNGDVFWPIRYALSGAEKSPSPAELAEAIGQDQTILRINEALKIL